MSEGASMQPERRGSVVEMAWQGGRSEAADALSRSKVLDRLRLGDTIFRNLTRAAALLVLVILGGVIVALFVGSWPALRTFGVGFLVDEARNPGTQRLGATRPLSA